MPADPGGPVRVLVADDEALVRAGFRVLVDSAPDLTVVGEAVDGVDAVRQTRRLRPDVVLMDIRMPVMDGLEATQVISSDTSPSASASANGSANANANADADADADANAYGAVLPRILVVTTFDQDEHVFAALRGGASGFVLKDTRPEDLLDAIRVVAQGDALLAPAVTRRLISEFVRRPRPAPATTRRLDQLTGREHEILVQVAAGRSNAEIAEALSVSVATVKTHVSRLLTKLQVRDRTQLVVFAYETGTVVPGHGS